MLCICQLSRRATTNRYPSWERGQKEMEIMPLPVFRSDSKNPCPRTPCNYLSLTLIILSCAFKTGKNPMGEWHSQNANCNSTMALSYSLIWELTNPLALPYTSIGASGVCRRSTMGREFHTLLYCVHCPQCLFSVLLTLLIECFFFG